MGVCSEMQECGGGGKPITAALFSRLGREESDCCFLKRQCCLETFLLSLLDGCVFVVFKALHPEQVILLSALLGARGIDSSSLAAPSGGNTASSETPERATFTLWASHR